MISKHFRVESLTKWEQHERVTEWMLCLDNDSHTWGKMDEDDPIRETIWFNP